MAYRCGQIASGSVSNFGWKLDVSHFNEESVARGAPFIQSDKESPYRKYTSRIFRNSLINMSSVHLDQEEVCEENEDGTYVCEFDHRPNVSIEEEEITLNVNNDDDDAHLPAGQHLLIDIKNVNSDFLSSEVRLAQAMIDVVNESQLTLLSYHCHRLLPMGVSCVGVLLESHISFHTWPLDGVISLDLFTCGSGLLVPVIPLIEKLFALPREMVSEDDHLDKPIVLWSHKLRGFGGKGHSGPLAADLGSMLLDSLGDFKTEVASVQTKYQQIDIYTYIDELNHPESYHNHIQSLSNDGSYHSKNPRFFRPGRLVFLDGVMQSTLDELEAYHEALVQPAMFMHKNPKRAAIIGGGEGRTLKEVLKHNTIERVKMIEIDHEMVDASKKYLPEWNTCSDLEMGAEWCGDDDRAEIHYEDAVTWFKSRFSVKKMNSTEYEEEQFDVIIMDALDPQVDIPFSEILYEDEDFIKTLHNSLTDDGVIVFQLGESSSYNDPADEFTNHARRQTFIHLLIEAGFENMFLYEEPNCGFGGPWVFLIIVKDAESRSLWYRNEAQLQVEIHKRMFRSTTGKPALEYFDGSVFESYRAPHKVMETIYCRTTPTPIGCPSPNKKVADVQLSNLHVGPSTIGDGSGRGVFTDVDIEKGSTVARKDSKNPIHFPPAAFDLLMAYNELSDDHKSLYNYMDGYGWESDVYGRPSYFVDSSILTFANHGCDGSFNIDDIESLMASYITDESDSSDESEDSSDHGFAFNPPLSRRILTHAISTEAALRDIKAGEELFCNYLFYAQNPNSESWTHELQELCHGDKSSGLVTQEERRRMKKQTHRTSNL
jgi:spermidine synthase